LAKLEQSQVVSASRRAPNSAWLLAKLASSSRHLTCSAGLTLEQTYECHTSIHGKAIIAAKLDVHGEVSI